LIPCPFGSRVPTLRIKIPGPLSLFQSGIELVSDDPQPERFLVEVLINIRITFTWLKDDLINDYSNSRIGIPTENWKIDDNMIIRAVKSKKYKIFDRDTPFIDSENLRSIGDFIEMKFEIKKMK